MKLNRSTNWIRIALGCWALALVTSLLILPVLAKGISDPIQLEKLDIRSIPVPLPPEPLAINDPPVSAAPSPSLLASGPAPQPIPVPIPPVSAAQIAPVPAERQMPVSSIAIPVHIANRQEFLAMALMFIVLLIWVWLHRVPGFHSLNKENA